MPTAPTLDCQLLCASVAAYGIDATGKLDPVEPYSSTVGFLAPPITVVAGEDEIDAALVGTTAQGVVLAFRGTIPPNIHDQQSLLDWMSDLTDQPLAASGLVGKVHDGFWQSLVALWEPLLKAVKQQMQAAGQMPLYITGHSKGGALSSLAALRLKIEAGITPTAVYTYASPHPGDVTFANQYNQEISNHLRYEYGNDIVPHVVPDSAFIEAMAHLPELGKFFKGMETWNYGAVGTLKFIQWEQHNIVNASPELHLKRLARLAAAIAEGRFEEIVAAHFISQGSGYMAGVCSSTFCAG